METLPAKIDTNLDEVIILPVEMVLPEAIRDKLEDVIEKWGSYSPAMILGPDTRELEYRDYSARKKLIKAIEAKQKLFNQPVKDLLEQVNSSFKAAINAISSANAQSEKAIQVYDADVRAKLEAQRREQQAILDAEAAAEKAKLAAKAAAERVFDNDAKAELIEKKIESVKPLIAGLPEVDNSGERLTWHFEITDPDLVPDLWRIPSKPDEVKIGQMVRNAKGQVHIEGVRVYSKTTLAGSR